MITLDKKKEVATTKPSILAIMADKYDLNPGTFLNTVKKTLIPTLKNGKVVSNEEIAAFLIVAKKYNLNPFTNEIYAFPAKKGGIVPVVGVDGFVTIMNRQPGYNGYEMTYSDETLTLDGGKECPEWAEVKIFNKDRDNPTVVREYLDEVYVPARGDFSGPWQSHTKRMLRHKALIQAIRIAFGIVGIYDPDEANRIPETIASGNLLSQKPEVDMPESIEQQEEAPPQDDAPQGELNLITEKQAGRLFAIAKKNGYSDIDIHEVLDKSYGIPSVKGIQKEYYEDVVALFEKEKVIPVE